MSQNADMQVLFKLKDAIEKPATHLAAAQQDPVLGPILAKLSKEDMASLGKVVGAVKPLSFCNHAPV